LQNIGFGLIAGHYIHTSDITNPARAFSHINTTLCNFLTPQLGF